MDRVRVGLTGLGAVFLLTLGASLTFGAADRDQPAAHAQKEPGEPLAQLGVAPGSEKGAAAAKPRKEGLADNAGDDSEGRGAGDRSTGDGGAGDRGAGGAGGAGGRGAESPIAAALGAIPGEPFAT